MLAKALKKSQERVAVENSKRSNESLRDTNMRLTSGKEAVDTIERNNWLPQFSS